MKLAVIDTDNKEVGAMQIKDLSVGTDKLISQALLHEYHNKREALAHTKDRGDVRGGGLKPRRQKGTGRARAGSSRSPLWRGGGVTFGPRANRNFKTRLPKKMRALATQSLFAIHMQKHTLKVVEDIVVPSGKTKDAYTFLAAVGVLNSALLIRHSYDVATVQAFANIQGVHLITANELQLLDLGSYSVVLLTRAAGEQFFDVEVLQPTEPKPKTTKTLPAKKKAEAT